MNKDIDALSELFDLRKSWQKAEVNTPDAIKALYRYRFKRMEVFSNQSYINLDHESHPFWISIPDEHFIYAASVWNEVRYVRDDLY